MLYRRFFLLFLIFVTLLPAARAAVELDHIVAVVNDDVVMASELNERVRTVKDQMRQQGTQLPPTSVLKKQVLDRLILNKLQLQMARDTGIRVDDETLNRTISNIAAENQVSLAEFRNILERDGYSYPQFREDIRNEIMISRLRQRAVDNRVSVTDREIENFLSTQEHQGEIESEYRLSHILIALPSSPSTKQVDETRDLAEKVLDELNSGADFGKTAATYSDGQQALQGGDLGWRKASELPTLFSGLVSHMDKGEISDLIRSPSGYHIIKVTGVRDSEKTMITQTHARHILIKPDELTTDEDAVRRLKQLKLRIEGGADFGELARGHSNDTVSAADGGDLGWVNPGDLVPQFEEVMDSLKPGEVSNPFKTQFGWHIVQVLERREHDSTEDLKRARARKAIRQRKLEEARENWLREMRENAYVEYRLDE